MAFIIPDIFSPYVQGVETARQANWQDLENYNKVQAQQLANAFALATFSPRADLPYTQAEQARLKQAYDVDTYNYELQKAYQDMLKGALGVETAGMQTQVNRAQLPGALTSAEIMSGAAGPLTQAQVAGQLSNIQSQMAINEFYNQNPLAMYGSTAAPAIAGATGTPVNPADMSSYGQSLEDKRLANQAKADARQQYKQQAQSFGTATPLGFIPAATSAQPIQTPQVTQTQPTATTAPTASQFDRGSFVPDIFSSLTAQQSQQVPTLTASQQGSIVPGNIDLTNRPQVRMPDGSIATVRSASFNIDGQEVLLPTVSDDGRLLTNEEALQQFRQTGRHLGIFATPEDATNYAKQLSASQGQMLGL